MNTKGKLKDWNLERIAQHKGILRLEYIEQINRYYLSLGFEHGYREFLIADNGFELNFKEIGQNSPHLFGSMPLPVCGSDAETNETVVHYRIMQWVQGLPIDYDWKDQSPLTEEQWSLALTHGK
jgi:hypothetical protein